ncbi:hypothetical protein BGZ95_005089 [Linnemannia exigua]|uniref:Transcription activator GCR1-like domain-containing protein n=1 Tax=Linnemannia exigua TaxID=604196 RepID=A0AAD4D4D7_9FUNG|nr:hypothetical protein BGZ95_005089 [Linnemannia exigua]
MVLSEITKPQDEDENDADDFQTRPGPTRSMVRTRRHVCGQDHNNNSSSSIAGTPTRDLSRYPPYPEHLGSSLPTPLQLSRSAAHTRRGIIDESSQSNFASQTPLCKRSPSKLPTSFSDAFKIPNPMTTLRKPKVEEQDDEHRQFRLSLTLPVEGSAHAHEADVYKALEDHGTNRWRAWCTDMHYEDKDQVTPIKLKDYIDFVVMPKERDMMKESWRLPGHPGFMAVSGLELYVRPVVNLWCEQSLQAELDALRDTKLRASREQQPLPQQTPEQQRLSSQLRQTKPIPKTRQQPLPQKPPFIPAKRRSVKAVVTAATSTTLTNRRAEVWRDDKGKFQSSNKDSEKPEEVDEQEDGIETRGEDKYIDNDDKQDRDGGSGNHIVPEKDSDQGHQTETIDDQYVDKGAAAGEGVTGTTLLSASVAPSTSTLLPLDSPSLPLPSLRLPPPTQPSSQPPGFSSRIRANDVQLVIKDPTLPKLGLGARNKGIRHHLSSKIETIAGVLTEWVVGIEGGPSIQQLNSVYGLTWQYSDEEKEYSGRETIVREFKRLVVEDGKTDETALRLLEEEVSSSSKKDLVARLKSTRVAKLVE